MNENILVGVSHFGSKSLIITHKLCAEMLRPCQNEMHPPDATIGNSIHYIRQIPHIALFGNREFYLLHPLNPAHCSGSIPIVQTYPQGRSIRACMLSTIGEIVSANASPYKNGMLSIAHCRTSFFLLSSSFFLHTRVRNSITSCLIVTSLLPKKS